MSDEIKQPRTPKRAHRAEKEESSSMLHYLMIGAVVLLLVFSVVQTVQINALKDRVKTGSTTTSVAAAPAAPAPTAPAPRAAPTMVGGC